LLLLWLLLLLLNLQIFLYKLISFLKILEKKVYYIFCEVL
jgi:hypothetical protein